MKKKRLHKSESRYDIYIYVYIYTWIINSLRHAWTIDFAIERGWNSRKFLKSGGKRTVLADFPVWNGFCMVLLIWSLLVVCCSIWCIPSRHHLIWGWQWRNQQKRVSSWQIPEFESCFVVPSSRTTNITLQNENISENSKLVSFCITLIWYIVEW